MNIIIDLTKEEKTALVDLAKRAVEITDERNRLNKRALELMEQLGVALPINRL